jgi:glycosyltransferase involved in cell wall biosynthesis
MKIFIEKIVNDNCSRGPSKFTNKLVNALKAKGVICAFEPEKDCTISFTLPVWKQNFTRFPRIIRVDGMFPGTSLKKKLKMRKRILRANHVVWQSKFARDQASKLYGVKPEGTIIYNGDDPDAYNVNRLDRRGKKWVITCANWMDTKLRYRPEKRLDQIVEVADLYYSKHPDVVFLVAGDAGRPDLARPNVRLLGKLKHPDLIRYIISSNCMLFMGIFDICPNAVVESLVPGTPVICCNGNGAAELVSMGFGEVLQMDKPIDLKEYASQSFRVPRFSTPMVMGALDRWCGCEIKKPAEKLFISNIADQYIEVFKKFERKA